jgi:IPT/TIG domain
MHSSRISKVLISSSLILVSLTLVACAFAQANPVPFLNQPLAPASVDPGRNDFTLSVFGTGFTADSKVRWNDKNLNSTFVSSGELAAQVPAAYIHEPTTAQVSVGTSPPGGGIECRVFPTNKAYEVIALHSGRLPTGLSAWRDCRG